LYLHPGVEIVAVSAHRSAGKSLADVFGHFRGIFDHVLRELDTEELSREAEVVFTALPHGQSAKVVTALRAKGTQVIDLSADYRLDDLKTYETWYGNRDPHPEQIEESVYGLPEVYRDAIRSAELVAAPGCYPTSALLAIGPLVKAGLVESEELIVDSKSGVSGAGRGATLSTHLSEVGEGIRAYKIGGTHRHTPEMEQELSKLASAPVRLSFTPHLVPMSRGILTCVYGRAKASAAECERVLRDAYLSEPFVEVLEGGALPDTAFVRGSNRAQVAVRVDERTNRVIALCAIDNLVKGSSGQAIQCMNLMRGLPEETGLSQVALFP
jgi:N-acetyl-gamma-glutamyl-phosphate reductase